MEFRFTPEQETFRQEVRNFLKKELPADYLGPATLGDESDWAVHLVMKKKLAQRGWLTLAWPREYGGMAASHVTQMLFNEEMAYQRAPGRDAGISQLGPTLMIHGSEEHKRKYLPAIARGEIQWCQGYSEPGSGSDLASLQTRAVEDGDDFVINGSKIWTSGAHHADMIFLMARTDPDAPKHRGISFLITEMKTPGITHRPIINMVGVHSFNQVFFDNVRIPKSSLVGEKNRGWYVGATLLDFERSGVEYPTTSRRTLENLAAYLREDGTRLSPSQRQRVRHQLADRYVEAEASRLLAYKVAWMQSQGMVPNKEASISKVFGTEVLQRVAHTGMELLGLYGQLEKRAQWAPLHGVIGRLWMCAISPTIGAGTSEIQRNIIATRGLSLPRG